MIITLLWTAIVFFIVMSFFLGGAETLWLLFLSVGVLSAVVGFLKLVSRRFNEWFASVSKPDPGFDKMLSAKPRYIGQRYYFGGMSVVGGCGMIALYWITHQQLVAIVADWLSKSF